jgi:hypothetical protein
MPQVFVNDDGELFMAIGEGKIRKCEMCVLCDEPITDDIWGNNPAPLKDEGVCCSDCNYNKVVPARFKIIQEQEKINYKKKMITMKRTVVYVLDYDTFGDYMDADMPEDKKLRLWEKMCKNTTGLVESDTLTDTGDDELVNDIIADTITKGEEEILKEDGLY